MSQTDTSIRFDWIYSLRLAFLYGLAKLTFIHSVLPKKLTEQLPTGWNNKMFWTAFSSGGKSLYYDYYCKLKQPQNYRPKTAVEPQYQLTEQDIQFFHENGYLGPFDLISPDEAEGMRQYLIDSVMSTKSSQAQNYQLKKSGYVSQGLFPKTESSQSDELREYKVKRFETSINRHLDDEKLLDLMSHPAVVERCAQLLGPDLLLWRSGFFKVDPHGKGTGFHQNSAWLYQNAKDPIINPPRFDELFQLTCWVALTEAREDNGGMIVVPGTQKEIYPLKPIKEKTDESGELMLHGNNYFRDVDYPIDSAEKVSVKLKPGQFFIFCERVIHGSNDNITDAARWAVNFRFVRPDTRVFTKKMLEQGHKDTFLNLENYSLDNWGAVLVRGEDNFGYNRLFKRTSRPKVEQLR